MARSGIMLCYPFSLKRLEKWGSKAFIQYKLNGERCRAIIKHDQVSLYSSEGNIFQFLPHINRAIERLTLGDIELDGELYSHGMALQEIHGIVSRKVNPHIEAERIEYHIFDIVDDSLPQMDRFAMLLTINQRIRKLGLQEELKVVMPDIVMDERDIYNFLERAVNDGYEGFVIRKYDNFYERKRSTSLMKFKPTREDIYSIVGYEEEVSILGKPKGSLGSIVCLGDDNTVFSVGTGFSRDDRRELWKNRESLVGKYLKVKYQYLTIDKKNLCTQ